MAAPALQRESRDTTQASDSARRDRLRAIGVTLFGCATAFFHAYAAPIEVWRPQCTYMLGMLGSCIGIISSIFKGGGSPGTDKILDFWHSLAIDDIVCAFLQLYP
jgi:hypothetical protein